MTNGPGGIPRLPRSGVVRALVLAAMITQVVTVMAPVGARAAEAAVTTGKADYHADEVVDMYGTGFVAGETYDVVVVRPDGSAVLYESTGSGPGEQTCYDADAADGTDCAQSVTAGDDGAWTNFYQLNGVPGEYRINVYGAGGTLAATATFTDAASLAFTGSDGLPHSIAAQEEDLGSVAQGSPLSLTCPRGTGLTFGGTRFGATETIAWDLHFFFEGVGNDAALLEPLTTLNPTGGTLSGADPSDCIAADIDTTTLSPGTYRSILEITTTEAGGKTRWFKYYFRFTVTEAAADLTVTKTATPSYVRTFRWTVDKSVDRTLAREGGATAAFDYSVVVTRDAGTDHGWKVTGDITVANDNDFPVPGVDVTDAVDNGGECAVAGGTDVTVPANDSVTLAYSCSYASAPSSPAGTNTATAAWPATGSLAAGSADGTAPFAFGAPTTVVDDCVDVSDAFGGAVTDLGTICGSHTFDYTRAIPIVPGCVTHDNTATFTTNTTGSTGSDTQTVTVCGPARNGGRTIGFWQNKNGQAIITGSAASRNVCNVGTWLRQYAPFQDLSSRASCTQVGSYVYDVIRSANAGGTSMNPMLKAQMLATALNVYFSTPSLGGNAISAPAPLGGVVIDLTHVCTAADDRGGGTCTGTFRDASAAFGGASSLTVNQMLAYAASRSNSGGSVWYSNVKATQELAKDAFDAINNDAAFSP